MLSDDITGTVGKGVSMVGAVIGGGIRGAILGAALVVGVAALAGAIGGFLGAAGIIAGIGAAAGGAIAGAAGMFGIGSMAGATIGGSSLVMGTALMSTAATIGAVVLGTTSVIPGSSQWFGLKGLLSRRQEQPNDVPSTYMEPQRDQVRNVTFNRSIDNSVDNNYLYQPDGGTRAMNRGNANSAQGQVQGQPQGVYR